MTQLEKQYSPPFYFGVDIGGTNIKIGLLDDAGQTLGYDSISTHEPEGPEQAIRRSAETCRSLMQAAGLNAADIPFAGLGAPGPMCLRRGLLLDPVNLPHWHEFQIQSALEEALQIPVGFVNDANAAAYGEYWVGTGEQFQSLVLFTLGTGVGGGAIVDGRLVNGINSFGSETGHIIVDCRSDARLCVWGGGRGHLEAYASASAVAARATERLQSGEASRLSELLMSQGAITAKDVYEAAEAEDQLALDIIDETAFYLGVGTASVVHSFDPGIVVFGGAMDFGGAQSPVGRRFLQGIETEFHSRTFPNVRDGTRIKFATLGGKAGYIGAAGIARQEFHNQSSQLSTQSKAES